MGDFLFYAGFMDRMVVLVPPVDVDNSYVLVVEIYKRVLCAQGRIYMGDN
jgi:hypothetical protein